MHKNDWLEVGDFLSITILTNDRGCDRIKSGRENRSRYAAKRSSIYAFAFDILPLGNSIYPSGERGRKRKRGTIGGEEKRRKEKKRKDKTRQYTFINAFKAHSANFCKFFRFPIYFYLFICYNDIIYYYANFRGDL